MGGGRQPRIFDPDGNTIELRADRLVGGAGYF